MGGRGTLGRLEGSHEVAGLKGSSGALGRWRD